MSVKKRYTAYTLSAAVFVLAICMLAVLVFSHGTKDNAGTFYTEKIDAIQFGDLSSSTVSRIGDRFAGNKENKENGIVFTSFSRQRSTDALYDILLDGLRNEKEEISFDGLDIQLTKEELNAAFTKVLNSNPELFYVKSAYTYYAAEERILYVVPQYTATGNALAEQKKEYEKLVSGILKEVNSSWSDLEKVLFVHDYIVKNFRYDPDFTVFTEDTVYDVYRFLKNRIGVCQAYTLLAIDLFNRLEINSGAVASIGMNHVWNCVEIDGKWYHLDITWDDAMTQGNFDRFDDVLYTNFLCGNGAIEASGHYEWDSDLLFDDGYDNFFVKELGPCVDIAPLGDNWYILVKNTEARVNGLALGQIDFENNTYNRLAFLPVQWFMWGSTTSYYLDTYAGLGSYADTLVISTADTLYAYDPITSEITELKKYTYDDGYIYGMIINGSNATFRVAKLPKFAESDRYVTVDLSDIKFTVEISYENVIGEELSPKYTAEIGWGKEFSVDFPIIDGYTVGEQKLSGKMPIGGIKHRVVYEIYRKLTVNYVYENGETAHESYVNTLASVGKEYVIPSPVIPGYLPDIKQVEVVMTDEDVTLTVIYASTLYSIKINYVYKDGTEASAVYELTDLEYMTGYSVESPKINGYTADVLSVAGNITENIEITVIYTPINCKISVEYVYSDGSLIDTKVYELPFGTAYEIVSPAVEGHTPDTALLSGIADNENIVFRVVYSTKKYTLTIKYVHINGEQIYEPYVLENMEHMAEYSVTTPQFGEYIPSVETVSGNITEDTEITVVYHLDKYTVKFMSEGYLFYSAELDYGSVIELPMSIPVKTANEKYYYIFLGWDGYYENITVNGDMVFNASFEETIRSYTVVFRNYDGTILYMDEVEYGGSANYRGRIPEHDHEAGKTCEFVGWNKSTDNIRSDTELTAIFSDGTPIYTVYFYDWDGTLISTQKVIHGSDAILPDAPSKESDHVYSYIFESWDGMYENVKADSNVTAKYKAVYIDYRITLKNYDGSVLEEIVLHYGDSITVSTVPLHEGTELYEYIFSGWSPALPETVTGNAEYTAQFTEKYRFAFVAQDLIDAVGKIEQAKTLEERFEAISEAYRIREDIYLKDPDIADALAILEVEIEKYNSEVKKVNEGFAKAVEISASANGFSAMYVTFFALLWAVLKKLLGAV